MKTKAGKTATVTKKINVEYYFLYNRGNDNYQNTNGWHQQFYTATIPSYYGVYAMPQMLPNKMYIYVKNTINTNSRSVISAYTGKKIDLSKWEYIYFGLEGSSGDATLAFTCNTDSNNNVDNFKSLLYRKIPSEEKDKVIKINIANIKQSCYVGFFVVSTSISPASNTFLSINSIYLE